ncbi:uncharacterized protein LOC111696014 isoform X2 [Eurytemora carolleeae]|uniref:uncharacterized protein LOC111696014 isoform X2 n=1 Tax=Eurytemora carolleeae TaxID=1294199 RepID=UPI000C771660|nr:uncharacterized protein LOC111696014 isoform X2 [Eurytemora carolleeae]|eukprot:XP_023321298.1 uncharacterized protein LOC111696014 isoform X2 [Eurytemora affinis]
MEPELISMEPTEASNYIALSPKVFRKKVWEFKSLPKEVDLCMGKGKNIVKNSILYKRPALDIPNLYQQTLEFSERSLRKIVPEPKAELIKTSLLSDKSKNIIIKDQKYKYPQRCSRKLDKPIERYKYTPKVVSPRNFKPEPKTENRYVCARTEEKNNTGHYHEIKIIEIAAKKFEKGSSSNPTSKRDKMRSLLKKHVENVKAKENPEKETGSNQIEDKIEKIEIEEENGKNQEVPENNGIYVNEEENENIKLVTVKKIDLESSELEVALDSTQKESKLEECESETKAKEKEIIQSKENASKDNSEETSSVKESTQSDDSNKTALLEENTEYSQTNKNELKRGVWNCTGLRQRIQNTEKGWVLVEVQ